MRRNVLSFILLALIGSCAIAQQGPIRADGTEILRGLLKYHGFKPLGDARRLTPGGNLIVIVGKLPADPQLAARLSRQLLLNRNGLLVIAEDLIPLSTYLPNAKDFDRNTSITGLRVNCTRPENCFDGDARMPFASLGGGGAVELQALGALDRVATRNPSTIFSPPNPYLGIELAKFPPGSRYVGLQDAPVGLVLGAMSDPQLPSTAMVFSSRAMFTNELMVAKDANGQPGTQNFLFTYWLTTYLKNRIVGNNDTREVLFIEDGQIVTDFDSVTFAQGGQMPKGIPPIMPPLPVLLAFAFEKGNEIVGKLEEKDIPHALLKNHEKRTTADAIATVAVIASIILCWYLLTRGWRTRQSNDLAPRPKILVEGDGGMISERRQGLLDAGNLFEPMRDHVRYLFKQWGTPAIGDAQPPPIQLDRPTRPAQRIVTDLQRLWQIAYGSERRTITLDEMEEYEDMIQDLTAAHAKGIWKFHTNGGEA